jgi:hypothetical protein
MSDFLARIAARSVGERPAARPRLPALLAEPASALAESPEASEDEAVVAPPPHVPRAAATAPTRPVALSDLGGVEAAGERVTGARKAGDDEGSVAASAAPARQEPSDAGGERSPPPPRSAPAPEPDALEADGRTPPPFPAPNPAPPPGPGGTRAVRALSATTSLARPRSRAAAPAPAPRAREAEPAPVRVHIGRLEVRATLQQPEREPTRREQPRSPELSLADYLRGKREAG